MDNTMKMRASMQDGVADVRVLIKHVMETGYRKDKATGGKIPAHFINQVTATWNGRTVLDMQWGVAISQNPYIRFKIKGAAPGDKVAVRAIDNFGAGFYDEAVIA